MITNGSRQAVFGPPPGIRQTNVTAPPLDVPQMNPALQNALANNAARVQAPSVNMGAVAAPLAPPTLPTQPMLDIRSNQMGMGSGMGFAEGGMVPPTGMPMAPQPGMPAAPAPAPQTLVPIEQMQAEIQRVMRQNPQAVEQIRQAMLQALQSGQLSMQDLNMAIQMAVAAAQNPALYPKLRQLAIQRGLASEQDLPPNYDQGIVFALLAAGAALQQGGMGGAGAAPQPPAAMMASGGYIPKSASPTGDQTGRADDIPIRVSGGEFVIPKHVVDAKGTDFFNQMLDKYSKEKKA